LADLLYPLEGESENAERLAEELKNRQDDARDSIAVAQRKQKKYFDQRRKNREFEVGDLVMLKLSRFGPGYKPSKDHDHKLAPLGTPLRIIEKLSPLSYRLALPADARFHDVVSIIHLRKYRGTGEGIRPMPILINEHDEFEVERIDGQRSSIRGVKEYLVKWKGYGDKERTWEPLSNLENADQAVANWHARQVEVQDRKADKPTPTPSTRRTTRAGSLRQKS
jgi:Chromo (CHRromatin Organisation MOdifier) domain